jgi:hypothetical protein
MPVSVYAYRCLGTIEGPVLMSGGVDERTPGRSVPGSGTYLLRYPVRREEEDQVTVSLHDVLRRFGVDEDEFGAALIEFADRTGPVALVSLAPADYLAESQQATLRRLGATLEPLRVSELGPVAGMAAAHADLVRNSLSVPAVAKRLGVDTSRVRQRIYAGSLFAFKRGNTWLVPEFQLQGEGSAPGIAAVLASLPESLHPVAVARWFVTPDADLILGGVAVSPLEWLTTGGPPGPVAALGAAVDRL